MASVFWSPLFPNLLLLYWLYRWLRCHPHSRTHLYKKLSRTMTMYTYQTFFVVYFDLFARAYCFNQSVIWYIFMSESRCEFILAKNATSRVFTRVEPSYLCCCFLVVFLSFSFIHIQREISRISILVSLAMCVSGVYNKYELCLWNINMCSRPHIVRARL